MDELLRQIAFIRTIPGAIDDDTAAEIAALHKQGDLHGMAKVLNARKYATGHVFQVVTLAEALSVTWERV